MLRCNMSLEIDLMSRTAAPSAPASLPAWHEVGRSWPPGSAAEWTAWVAPLGGWGGGALYRSLVVAEGAAVVTIDLLLRRGAGAGTVHRGRCDLPRDATEVAGRIHLLLAAADEAAVRAVEAARHREECATAGRGTPQPRRATAERARDCRPGEGPDLQLRA